MLAKDSSKLKSDKQGKKEVQLDTFKLFKVSRKPCRWRTLNLKGIYLLPGDSPAGNRQQSNNTNSWD
ncbi:mCG148053 [Mus musculus]|jgi:hypothetical protein|nr:mCG148053 [Mus musculus]